MPKSLRRSVRWDTQAASYQVIEQAANTITASNLDFQSHVWQQWLEQVSSFAFQSKHGHHFTARKEARARGDIYWIAYRKVSGKLIHKYLGRTIDVTLSRLEQVAATLAGQEIQATISELTDGHRENSMQEPLADQLLATKFFVPSSPHVLVSRPRLSTLLARVAWVSLDEQDNDPVGFWMYVFTALDRLQPGLCAGRPSLTSRQPIASRD